MQAECRVQDTVKSFANDILEDSVTRIVHLKTLWSAVSVALNIQSFIVISLLYVTWFIKDTKKKLLRKILKKR